jgi:hypothetical protein
VRAVVQEWWRYESGELCRCESWRIGRIPRLRGSATWNGLVGTGNAGGAAVTEGFYSRIEKWSDGSSQNANNGARP